MPGEAIRVTGRVQGVGFRPTVWRLAHDCELTGQVWNDAEGVLIHAWGDAGALQRFVERLQAEPPPLARIESLRRSALSGPAPEAFTIVASRPGDARTEVAPDAATCPDCLRDLLDPGDRRYRYPFTNCTHCGPRLSIVRAIPYDRANTSMACFPLCPRCRGEYRDPADRRFHAQPNACPVCGPRVWLERGDAGELRPGPGEDAITLAARLIARGEIVAVKGIGGIHLACDATDAVAVERLRQRKSRFHKPFALMARDLQSVRRYARVGDAEAALLQDRAAPIVVLDRRPGGEALAPQVAPGQNGLGFMLPYTPLHWLLMAELPGPIVLTSGNRSDEPQCIDNDDARTRLAGIADALLLHDRAIVNRLDDSVVRLAGDSPQMLRRARGYAPAPLSLPEGFAPGVPLLAMGGELKNTFCLVQRGEAVLSQHMGDLEEAATFADYRHNLALYAALFDHRPCAVAVDLHPNYLSSQLGRALAAERALPLVEVQHHHAHVAATMAEHGLPLASGPLLGIALDGLGYGADGTLWGGEFLKVDYRECQRLASFPAVAMPGGVQAIREPWRNAWAHLEAALGWRSAQAAWGELAALRALASKPLANLQRMAERGLNSPPASSAGRLCDAAAALLDLHPERVSFEGQAAIELEALAEPEFTGQRGNGYPHALVDAALPRLDWAPLWRALLDDLAGGARPAAIAARFHHGLVDAVVSTARRLCAQHRLQRVVLSGGVFQNRLLLDAAPRLRAAGYEVLLPEATPANDGGVALGQAVVAAARLLAE